MFTRYKSKFALLIVILVLLTACGEDKQAEEDAERMTALGEEFVEEVNEIFADRESESRLRDWEAVVSTLEGTDNIEYLDQFYEQYEAGNFAELLMIFQTKAFVVSKVIFEGDQGYYFRYEYDTFDPDSIVVNSQFLDEVELVEDSELGKIELTLQKEKKNPIVITFRNVVRDE